MASIAATCEACGRLARNADRRKVLERPVCPTCGGRLLLSAADQAESEAILAQKSAAEERAARVTQLRCGFCARTIALRGISSGDSRVCTYCGCPFTVGADGASASPLFALAGPPPSVPALERAGAALQLPRFLEDYRVFAEPGPALRLAVRALQVRLALGAVAREEAAELLGVFARLARAQPPDGGADWVCPLPPAMACDLIERLLCPRRGVERDLTKAKSRVLKVRTYGPLEDGFVRDLAQAAREAAPPRPGARSAVRDALDDAGDVADILENVHDAWETAEGAFDLFDAIEAAGEMNLLNLSLKVLDRKKDGGSRTQEALEKLGWRPEAWLKEQEILAKEYAAYQDDNLLHFLRVTFADDERGSSLNYAHELSDGGRAPLDRCQRRLVFALQRGLARFAPTLAVFKAVYGGWLDAGCLQCLAEECFRERLQALHPDLSSFTDVYGLVRETRRS